MELPVYQNGERVGEAELVQQGQLWRARVQMADIGRVTRLSLYGRGESVYLGIPEPDGRGGMALERTLRAVPEGAEYAAERERMPEPETRSIASPEKTAAPRHVVWLGGRAYYF